MTAPPARPDRPRIVEVAFWVVVGGAVLLMFGGLTAATTAFDAMRAVAPSSVSDEEVRSFLTLYRAAGGLAVLAGGALAFLAGRTRKGDARMRRVTVMLAMAIVVVFGLLVMFAGFVQRTVVLALLPILVGAFLLRRPSVRDWFDQEETQ